MANTQFDKLIEKIARTINEDSEDIAEILQILNEQEKKYLFQKFGKWNYADELETNITDIRIKADAINSLVTVLINNPRLKQSLKGYYSNTNQDILGELYQVSFELYRTLFYETYESNFVEGVQYLTVSALNAINADRVAEIDVIIENHIDEIRSELWKLDVSDKALRVTICLLVLSLCKQNNKSSKIEEVNETFTNANSLLQSIQEKKGNNNEFDLGSSLQVAGLSNLIYLCGQVKKYLFTGELESNDQYKTLIDSYSYNAIKLINKNDFPLQYKIVNLSRTALKQLCKNSIWDIADRSAIFKEFFSSLKTKNDDFILSLLPTQRDSILNILTTKKSVVLNMPTSSGKSLLAELYILFTFQNFTNKDVKPTVAYLVPTNALTNQVSRKLNKVFEEFNYNIETVLPFYDTDEIEDEFLNRDHIDILISTPEKLDFMIRKEHPSLQNLKLVVLDEAHNLSDDTRGAKFELLLATLKQERPDVNYLLLSPFIDNASDIGEWLADSKNDTVSVSLQWTPTKQYIGCNLLTKNKTESKILYFPSIRNSIIKDPVEIDLNSNPHEFKEKVNEETISHYTRNIKIVEKYLDIGDTTMVLSQGSGSVEKFAKKTLNYFKAEGILEDISDRKAIQRAKSIIELEEPDSSILLKCLDYGIAMHHSKLSSLVKEQVEELARNNQIKVLCATTTLAQGMNFPISTIIFDTLMLGGGSNSRQMKGDEFWNIAGRAGRAFMDTEGHIVVKYQSTQKATKQVTRDYIKHDTNKIISSLNEFFDQLNSNTEIDFELIENNPAISNFLQYLNHIVRVAHEYDFETLDTTKLATILNSSLFYRELKFEEGFLESQQKIRSFANKYLSKLKTQNRGRLKQADLFGISNISLNKISGELKAYELSLRDIYGDERIDQFLKISDIVTVQKDAEKLADIVNIINRIPEMKLELLGHGKFDPESISKIIIGWVNGKNVKSIAKDISYSDSSYKNILRDCQQYVNGKLRTFVPWGVSIIQNLVGDNEGEVANNLPSYIYYGVNDTESVVLSKAGIPRFAVKELKKEIKETYPHLEIKPDQINEIKDRIKNLDDSKYEAFSERKKVVKEYVLNHV